MIAETDLPVDVKQPLRCRRRGDPPDAPTGELLYAWLAEPYLAAARAAHQEPTRANYRAAEKAAHYLASHYSSMYSLHPAGCAIDDYQAGQRFFQQARAYRALAAELDQPSANAVDGGDGGPGA